MNKLPREVLVEITDNLTFTEKLKLARVCNDTLSQPNLYNKITFKSLEKFQQVIQQEATHQSKCT